MRKRSRDSNKELDDEYLARVLQEEEDAKFAESLSKIEEQKHERRQRDEEDYAPPPSRAPWAARYRTEFDRIRSFPSASPPPPLRRVPSFGSRPIFRHETFAFAPMQREMTYEEMLALDDTIVKKTVVTKRELSSFQVTKQEQAAEEPCSICLDSFEIGDKVSVLPCLHKFHEHEILKWYKTSGSSKCPVCGVAVKD